MTRWLATRLTLQTILATTALTACVDGGDAPDATPTIVDFFGESCRSAPPTPAGEPVETVCRDGRGWCERDVCRPVCLAWPDYCPGGVERRDDANVCYCEPR